MTKKRAARYDGTYQSPIPLGIVETRYSTPFLSDDVQAFVGDHGLVAIEVSDTTRWGEPFDTDAARRAIAWTTAQLGMPAA